MAEKDLSTKVLEDHNDVFADIYNVLLFGNTVIEAGALKNGPTESIYKDANDFNREQRRDTIKVYAHEANLLMSFFGIENQSTIDWTIPIRLMGYDYGSYRQQISDNKSERKLMPVVTIVLNLSNEKWDKGSSLYDIVDVPEVLRPFVQNYECKIFDIAYLPDEVISQFTSDFKIVARFFKSKRVGNAEKEAFLKNTEKVDYPAEVLELFSVFTKDNRYKEIIPSILEKQQKGAEVNMCSIAQELEEKGKLELLFEMYDEGELTIQKACKKANMTEEEFLKAKENAIKLV